MNQTAALKRVNIWNSDMMTAELIGAEVCVGSWLLLS